MSPIELPLWLNAFGAWAVLGLKIAGAIGFVIATNLVVLYAS